MAEMGDRALNFGCGTRFALDFADAKSACAEIERSLLSAERAVYG
jgi:hypothetical protein